MSYTPGKDLLVTWAINNGDAGEHPTGTPTCTAPPTDPPTDHVDDACPTGGHDDHARRRPTTARRAKRTTQQQARFEAKQLLQSIKPQITSLKLDIPGVQLVGTYPIEGTGDDDVVQVLYSKATVQGNLPVVPQDVRRAAGRGRAVPEPGVRPVVVRLARSLSRSRISVRRTTSSLCSSSGISSPDVLAPLLHLLERLDHHESVAATMRKFTSAVRNLP